VILHVNSNDASKTIVPSQALGTRESHSDITWIACGGLLIVSSMFFRHAYGPWGSEISHIGILSHNLTWRAWPMLITVWPIGFGLIETILATATIVGTKTSPRRIEWALPAIFLMTIASLQLGMAFWYGGGLASFSRKETIVGSVGSATVLAALLLVTMIIQEHGRRSQAVRLIGTAWILVGLYPISEWTPMETVQWTYGMGYWILLAGTLLIFVVSIRGFVIGKYRGSDLAQSAQK
jgi:hypothetical protein